MLKNVKDKIDEPVIQKLIGMIVYDDPEQIEKAVNGYNDDAELEMMGYYAEQEIIGIVGFKINEDNVMELKHIAVLPEVQGMGYGRGMILEVIHLKNPAAIVAETDEETVEFFRSIGFTIESAGEKHPGAERFKCTYITNVDD